MDRLSIILHSTQFVVFGVVSVLLFFKLYKNTGDISFIKEKLKELEDRPNFSRGISEKQFAEFVGPKDC